MFKASTSIGEKPYFGSRINYGHPLATGITACLLLNEGKGQIINNIAKRGHVLKAPNTRHIWQAGPGGQSVLFPNDGDCFIARTSFTRTRDRGSMFAIIRTNVAAQSGGFILNNGDDSGGWGMCVGGDSGGSGNNIMGLYGAVAWLNTTVGGNSANMGAPGVWKSVGMSHKRSNQRFYIEGRNTTNITVNSDPNQPSGNSSLAVELDGSGNPGSRRFHGDILLAYMWDRILAPDEFRYLDKNPYCFLI